MNGRYLLWMSLLFALPLRGQSPQQRMEKLDELHTMGYFSRVANESGKRLRTADSAQAIGPMLALRQAEARVGEGMTDAFWASLRHAERLAEARWASGAGEEERTAFLLQKAEVLTHFGAYAAALEVLAQRPAVAKAPPSAMQAQWNIAQAQALIGQGHYRQADALLREVGPWLRRQQPAPAGAFTRKETKKNPLTELYAQWWVAVVQRATERGDFHAADSLSKEALSVLDPLVGREHIAYATVRFWRTDNYVRHGLLPTSMWGASEGYDRAQASIKVLHLPSHPLNLLILERSLHHLLAENQLVRFYNQLLEFSAAINGTYGKTSSHRIRSQVMDAYGLNARDQLNGVERDIVKLLPDSTSAAYMAPATIQALKLLAMVANRQNNYRTAEKYLRAIVSITAQLNGTNAPATHLARLQLANHLIDFTDSFDEAEKLFVAGFAAVRQEIHPWHGDNLANWQHWAQWNELHDRFVRADSLQKLTAAVLKSKYAKTSPARAAATVQWAPLEIKLGQYDSARAHLAAAKDVLDRYASNDTWRPALVRTIELQARLEGLLGNTERADQLLRQSRRLIKQSLSAQATASASSAMELSTLYIQLGRYQEVEKTLQQVTSDYAKWFGASTWLLIQPTAYMGYLLLAQGNYTDAENAALQSLESARRHFGKNTFQAVPSQWLLYEVAMTLGDYSRASELLNDILAKQVRLLGAAHPDVLETKVQLAKLKFYQGVPVETVVTEMTATVGEMKSTTGGHSPRYANALRDVALMHTEAAQYPQALAALQEAKQYWTEVESNGLPMANLHFLAGDVSYFQRQYTESLAHYQEGMAIVEKTYSPAHPDYVKGLTKSARANYQLGNLFLARDQIERALDQDQQFIKQFFSALSERQKAIYWNRISPDFDFYFSLVFSHPAVFADRLGRVYDYRLFTKAILLNTTLRLKRQIANSNNASLISLYGDWIQKKEALAAAIGQAANQGDDATDAKTLAADIEKIEKELEKASSAFQSQANVSLPSYTQIQPLLAADEVAVEVIKYPHFNHVFTDSSVYVGMTLTRTDAAPRYFAFPRAQHLEGRYFHYYSNSLRFLLKDSISYRIFWQPIKAAIGNATTVYFSPDGVFNQINLETVYRPGGAAVLDEKEIILVNNPKDIIAARARTASTEKRATLIGNPAFYTAAVADTTINDLPGTATEIENLTRTLQADQWQVEQFSQADASEELIKSLAKGSLVHIATHGFYRETKSSRPRVAFNDAQLSENPLLKSGLLLASAGNAMATNAFNYNAASGILTSYEAMNLDLEKTELVVLSACETGLGQVEKGEGVFGLQRAFTVAGAHYLIMSICKVDDTATQKLFTLFYEKWIKSGNIRKSFYEAKQDLRKEYPDPYYWGSFILIGV